MDYNSIERITPRWRAKWKRPLIKLGRSTGLIIPEPMLTCFGARARKKVSIVWAFDENTEREVLIIDFE